MVMVRMSLQGWANLSGMALILAVVPLPWILGRQAELRKAHPGALAPSTALIVTIVVLALALFTLTMVVAKLLGPF